MRIDVQLGTWARVADRCPLESSVNADGEVEVLVGGRTDGFEVVFTPEALERFLRVAGQALLSARVREDAESGLENRGMQTGTASA